jgi:hypothetical protein
LTQGSHTIKLGKKESEEYAQKKKLRQLFESFSMGVKHKKGLTFDEMTD